MSDTTVNYHTTSANITQSFKSWTNGVARNELTVSVNKNNGVNNDARVGHYYCVGGVTIGVWDSSGLSLSAGKTYKVNNVQVVGARQTGTPAAATDAATTMALVNDLRTKLIAHGLVS